MSRDMLMFFQGKIFEHSLNVRRKEICLENKFVELSLTLTNFYIKTKNKKEGSMLFPLQTHNNEQYK